MPGSIRDGTPQDDAFIAQAFEQMWLDIGYEPSELVSDGHVRTMASIAQAREALDFRAAIAEHEGRPAGCAAAQRFSGLYPELLTPQRRVLGYIWGVYVAPQFRRQGLGAALTQHCVEAMQAVGCHEVVLHAAPMGRNVYEGLGFSLAHDRLLA